MSAIVINDELRELIPSLSEDEYKTLEASIVNEGCREPLIVWQGMLIDGHNRYEICTKHGIAYSTLEKQFDDIDVAKVWMIDNQKGRRNLTDGWKFELAQVKKAILAEKGKEKLSESGKEGRNIQLGGLSIIDKGPEHNTRNEIAEELGWSTGKTAQADYVWKHAPEEIKERVKAGESSVNQAYVETKRSEKKENREKEIEETKRKIESGVIDEPEGLFDVINIDPPWNYGRKYDPEGSRVANPYPEMTQDQLLAIKIPAKEDSVLFLWTTHAFIFNAKQLLDSWGYSYKATLVWNKEKIGMGKWFRMQCEFCLVGIKGKPFFQNTRHRDIITEPRREHSRKPDAFYKMVTEVTAGKRLDYFSRENREGWSTYGAEDGKLAR